LHGGVPRAHPHHRQRHHPAQGAGRRPLLRSDPPPVPRLRRLMAIKVERDGNKTVLAQTRRGVRIAAWVLFALAVIGAVMSFREERAAQAIERTAVHCSRAAGVCGFTPSTGSGQVMHIDTLVAATVETDGSGDDARVTAAVTRRDGLPT